MIKNKTLLPHLSNSSVQKEIEGSVLKQFAEDFKCTLQTYPNPKFEGAVVDGWYENGERTVIVEVYARIDALKAGNKRKLLADALKLAWLGEILGPNTEKYILVTSPIVSSNLEKGWCGKALKHFGIQVESVDLKKEERVKLSLANEAQRIGFLSKAKS